MNTLYVIHEHSHVWAHDSEGNPLTATDRVIEFVPNAGKSSWWFMPECVGTFKPHCTACGTEELGEIIGSGVITDPDSLGEFIKTEMGSRFDYNDRLRSNYYAANQTAHGTI